MAAPTGGRILVFPRDFFGNNGKIPQSDEELLKRWPWRKSRPLGSGVDSNTMNAIVLRKEMQDMKLDLAHHIIAAVNKEAKEMAEQYGLFRSSDGQRLTLDRDLVKELSCLSPTPANHRLAYMILLEFHRKNSWTAERIDEWLHKNNYALQPRAEGEKNTHNSNRGNFSAVARYAKGQAVQNFTRGMISNQGWKVAATMSSKKASDHTYHKQELTLGKEKLHYYFVTVTNRSEKLQDAAKVTMSCS